MKKMKWLAVLLFSLVCCFALAFFTACDNGAPTGGNGSQSGQTNGGNGGGQNQQGGGNNNSQNNQENNNGGEDELLTITGVTFVNATVSYDGQEHEIVVTGTLPNGVTVDYEGNKGTNVGVYNATATLSGTGYKPLTLTATLTIVGRDIEGLTFPSDRVTYDGNSHTVEIVGIVPSGVNVEYKDNKWTNAGVYTAIATLTGAGYNTLVLKATLQIDKADFTGITFEGASYDYDGTAHTVAIVGALPADTSVVYSCEEDPTITNTATESGTYTIKATITNPNYNTLTLTATLKITGSEDERFITYANDTLYFGNALDKDKLYSYTQADGVEKVSSDVPYGFAVIGNKIYFRSRSLFASSIKVIGDGGVSGIASEKGEYLCTDGTYLYYAVNGLTGDKSGIYRLDPTASEPTPELVSQGKAKYLQVEGGYLWFADGANGWKLSKVLASATNAARTVVPVGGEAEGEKIAALTASNGYLFFTVNRLRGNYIANYNISNGETKKLTQDAGANLTVIGNDLYYINVDLLTSLVKGKGIYRVSAYPLTDSSAFGTKVIGEDGEKYSSLAAVGTTKIAYYEVSTQMLCIYTPSSDTTVRVLEDFTPPEYKPLSLGSKTLAYGSVLYYLDLYNDKALYSYDTVTGVFSRITSNKVTDFSILGDTLYFNAVSYGANNDLYRVDLKQGGEPELVSTNDCEDIVTDGENIFYVYSNAAGLRTAIHKITADGTDVEIYSKAAKYLTYYEGYLYFENGDNLMKTPVTATGDSDAVIVDKSHNYGTFVISDGVVYFRELYGAGQKRLSCINVDGSGYAAVLTAKTDPIAIKVIGDTIYYYTETTLGPDGFYSISTSARNDADPTLILAQKGDGVSYYGADFTVIGNKIYFVNYYNNFGDSHLYSVEIGGTHKVEKLA